MLDIKYLVFNIRLSNIWYRLFMFMLMFNISCLVLSKYSVLDISCRVFGVCQIIGIECLVSIE